MFNPSSSPRSDEVGRFVLDTSWISDNHESSESAPSTSPVSGCANFAQLILNQLSDVILITDSTGTLTFVSPSVTQVFGYTEPEVMALGHIGNLLDLKSLNLPELLNSEGIWTVEQSILDRTGQPHRLLVAIKPIAGMQGTLLFSCRDITGLVLTQDTQPATHKLEQHVQSTEPLQQLNTSLQREIMIRQQVETWFQDSQQRYQDLVQSLDSIVWEFDWTTQQFLFVSQRAEDLLGYPLANWLEEPDFWQAHIHPDDRDWVGEFCQIKTQQGQDHRFEYRMIGKDGQIVWLDDIVRVVVEQGEPKLLRGIMVDITDRKQAELALKQQVDREKLVNAISQRIRQSLDWREILETTAHEVRQFLEADRVLICALTQGLQTSVLIESLAVGWPSMQGWVIQDPWIISQEAACQYHQGQIRVITDCHEAYISDAQCQFLEFFNIRAKLVMPIFTGDDLWGLLIIHQCEKPRQWQAFEVTLLQQLADQISIAIQQAGLYRQLQQLNADLERQVEQRTAEFQQAVEAEAALRRITDKVRDSLDQGQILQTAVQELLHCLQVGCCNAALFDLEQGTSTIVYEHTTAFLPAKGRISYLENYPELYQQLLAGNYSQFCSLNLYSARGRVATLVCPIYDDQGVLGDLWLISDRHRMFSEQEIRLVEQVANQCAIALRQARLYQAAQAQVKELERLNQLKDDFLSTISHELRTPMANIKLASQMLQIILQKLHLLEDVTSPAVRYFQILNDECHQEMTLINNLLDLSRLSAGTEPLINTEINLQHWLPAIAEPFEHQASQQSITLQIAIPPDLPPIQSDLTYLERILSELLTNACKYTPAGEVIRLSTELIQLNGQSHVLIQVSNSGVEIPPEEQKRIFDRFYRIPNQDPWKYAGMGLGLALVKKLAEVLQGTVQVTSGEGWTTFTLSLPIHP